LYQVSPYRINKINIVLGTTHTDRIYIIFEGVQKSKYDLILVVTKFKFGDLVKYEIITRFITIYD